jgi:hypothetical protein
MLDHKQLSFWQLAAFYGILLVHFPVSATASGGNLMRHVTIYLYIRKISLLDMHLIR